uniref:cilia- and flagella-associated protein 43-like n=1 Tax=Styela clava TaxID=7725 RepID=UPI00193A3DEC|nr:cilia- and flagella-associated protein 43-like [Styela clava]
MEDLGSVQPSWAHGFDSNKIHHITNDVICYVCGSNIKFVNTTNKQEQIFPSPGNGIATFASSPEDRIFAIAESCLNPKIFICEYPSMKVVKDLEGGTHLEYKLMTFSTSEFYLATYSGIPEFAVTVWDWNSGQLLCKNEMKIDSLLTDISFNPLNWHQIFACGPDIINVLSLDRCNDIHLLNCREIPLPDNNGSDMHEDEHTSQSPVRSGNKIQLLPSTKARLVGENANDFKVPSQRHPLMQPTSHCWSNKGEVYVGCKNGQLFSLEPDSGRITILLAGQFEKLITGEVIDGMFNTISYNTQGIYCGGIDGTLRKIVIDKNGVKITKVHEESSEITTANFSPISFMDLIFGTKSGSIYVYNTKIENCRMVSNSHIGRFIGAGYSDGGNICVSCREDGTVQLWEAEYGTFVSSISIDCRATAFATCPSSSTVAVGCYTGHIYYIDINDPEKPRIVSRHRIHQQSVDCLIYTSLGLHLLSCSYQEKNIFVIDARPSAQFSCVGYIDCQGSIKNITMSQHSDDRTHFSVVVIPTLQKSEEENDETEDSSTSDRLLIFSLPNNGDSENKDERYQSLRKNFKDDFINKLTFDLTVPLDSAIVTEVDSNLHVVAISRENNKLLQFKFPDHQDDSTSIHNPSHEVDAHQLQDGCLTLSSHCQWIMTYAPDGSIIIRDKHNWSSSVSIKSHSYLTGGVSSALFSPDGQRILSTGCGDNSLISYSWSLTSKGRIAMNSALEYFRNLDMKLRSIAEKEDAVVATMKEWELPEYTAPAEQTDSTEDLLDNGAEVVERTGTSHSTIPPTPTPVPPEDATWLEEQLIIARKQENLQYNEVKRDLKKNIKDLRKTILSMMAENQTRPEVERLDQEEYNLDVEQQKQLQEMEETRVQQVREEIEFENLAQKYLKYIMQKEFWDDMDVKGRALKAFNAPTCITNYPMKERPRGEQALLDRVSRIRAAQIEELVSRKEIVEISTTQTSLEEEEEEEDSNLHPDHQLSLHGSLGPKYGGENELFYSQFDLHTREEKINQIVLVKDAIRRIKLSFNEAFTNAYQNKEQEIARVKEKNIRIREIMEDLDMDASDIKDPVLSIDEKPEKILTVLDEEVQVEHVLSMEQQKQLVEEQRQEQIRLEAAQSDNKRERGLNDMMGGVLEVKKEDILKQDIPLPEFVAEKPEKDWTDEERKMMKEHEKKQKDLLEEREKYRKNLENELKKIQQGVVEAMSSFDEQLLQLYNRKVKTEMVINQEESKILRLSSAVLMLDEINIQEEQINFMLEFGKTKKKQLNESEEEIRKLVDDYREVYDSAVAEDKILDRTFKRDFSDVPLPLIEPLYKLYKRRPRVQRQAVSEDRSHSYDPYPNAKKNPAMVGSGGSLTAVDDATQSTLNALIELDDPINIPEGLDTIVWQRLCSSRKTKVESELCVKNHASTLAEMTKYLQHLQDENEMMNRELEDIVKQQNKLGEDRMKNNLNLEIQFLLKQGQVEVETGDFIADYDNSILIHRPVVEDLNATIRGLGEHKVAAMTECKDFKKGIHQLEWERKKMMMQMDDLHNKARHIQMLKLAKDLQSYLNEENHQARHAKQMSVLEETLALQDKHLEKNVAHKQSTIRDLERTIRQKQHENMSLGKETEELHVSVSERNNIDEVNAAERAKHTADNRLRGIVQRRKLVDLAKAQAQEVAVLRAEVERLRMKTFPALVQIER